jgi:pimeloyl-ACP methyl ester carboxylesterase
VSTPITVVYGTADRVVPPDQSRAVAAAAAAAGHVVVVAVPDADHKDGVLLDGPELLDALMSLARRAGCAGD